MATISFTSFMTFALGLMGLALFRKHLVSALLCIEMMTLSLFITLALIYETLNTTNTVMQPLILLTMAACEAGAGLSLLVASTRTHASDHIKNLNLLKC